MRCSVMGAWLGLLLPVTAHAAFEVPLKACHRGIMSAAPENTEPAIQAAVGKAEILDLDLMVTNQGEILCAHDEKLNELDPKLDGRAIRALSRAEIKKINIGADLPYTRDGKRVDQHYAGVTKYCFLDEVFDKYSSQIIFWLDIKNRSYSFYNRDRDVDVLDKFLQSRKDVLDRVIISSTNPFLVIDLAKRAKERGYFSKLTIGLDYGDTKYFSRLGLEGADYEKWYGFNFMAVARENLVDGKGSPVKGQAVIDDHLKTNRNFKVLVYSYKPLEKPEFKRIYSYMIEYLQQYPTR